MLLLRKNEFLLLKKKLEASKDGGIKLAFSSSS